MSNELAISNSAPLSFMPTTLDQALTFSEQMSKAQLLPAHLMGKPADCLRIVMQSARWQMDPFSVADKTSVIGGKLMYEGQLVSAVVNARGNLEKRLNYKFDGTGPSRVLTVTGTIRGETEAREITLTTPQARAINKNGQMDKNPDQQMTYIGARLWARRHMPELMLGVYSDDEMPDPETLANVTPGADGQPAVEPVVERPKAPARRGGAAAAKEVTKDGAIDVTSTPVAEKPAEPAAQPKPEPAKVEPKPAEKVEPAPTAPDIAPGVNLTGYHGKAWPQLLTATIVSATAAATPAGKGVVKLVIESEGYKGDALTFEGVEMQGDEGKKVPVIIAPFLKAGETIEANFRAKLRPSKLKHPETGATLPDYTKPPALFAENVTAGKSEEF